MEEVFGGIRPFLNIVHRHPLHKSGSYKGSMVSFDNNRVTIFEVYSRVVYYLQPA